MTVRYLIYDVAGESSWACEPVPWLSFIAYENNGVCDYLVSPLSRFRVSR